MHIGLRDEPGLAQMRSLIDAVRNRASDVAVVILAEDAGIVEQLPALKRVRFLERLDNDTELNRIAHTFHNSGIACRVVFGFHDFMRLALEKTLFPDSTKLKVVFDRTEGGGHQDGFGPARRSTGALLCHLFGYHYSHANAYSAAITRHKHHQAMLLHQAGISVPGTWSFDTRLGWTNGKPQAGTKVICKSTFEAWSVGVSEDTVGPFGTELEYKIANLAKEIGQPVCVQEFIDGREIYALVAEFSSPSVVGLAEARSSMGPKANGDYLVFDDHYRPGGIVYGSCTDLSEETRQLVTRAAVATFRLLSMSYIGRIDFRIGISGTPFVMDIADNPGISPASSLAFIFNSVGLTDEELPLLLLGISLNHSELL